MKVLLPTLLFAAAMTASAGAVAQPASAPMRGASAPHGMGPGMGPGMGQRGMGPRWGSGVTPGWSMMTPEERSAHQQAMAGAKTREDCAARRDEQHAQMQARAKERGATLPAQPRRDVCEGLPKR
jgi:hypothetical protein